MNTMQQEEINQWIQACEKVIGEDNVKALIEHGYYMAVESFNKPLASGVADPYDFLLETPLKSKPEAYKGVRLDKVESEVKDYIRLVVRNDQ